MARLLSPLRRLPLWLSVPGGVLAVGIPLTVGTLGWVETSTAQLRARVESLDATVVNQQALMRIQHDKIDTLKAELERVRGRRG